MNITFDIPDELAGRIDSAGSLARRALEAFAIEEFRSGRITLAEIRKLLGFGTRDALDGFLKAHAVYLPFTLDDLEQDRRDLTRLGL